MVNNTETGISVVMLVYNEAEIIEKVIREYYEKVVSRLNNVEFIIAEDGSTDGTKKILKKLEKELPIVLVSGEQRKGYVQAYKDSIKLPKKDYIFFTDSSGKHDPDDFWSMIRYVKKYDVISGYKIKRKDPLYRVIMTRIFNRIVNLYFGTHFKDIDSEFKLIRRQAMESILDDDWIVKDLISFEVMVRLFYRGYKIIEVPVRHKRRENGASRGLPLKRIPFAVWCILSNFKKVKTDAMICARKRGNRR